MIDYVKTMVTNTETVIDTSSLLEPGFETFIRNNSDALSESGFKIIIPRAVRMELIKLISISNPIKASLALHASNVIAEYKEIFSIEPGHVSDEEAFKAFADRAILSRLTSNSGDSSQLLITNDKRLARDAFNINNLDSCRSHKVKVCFLNDEGQLCRCGCTLPQSTEESDDVPSDNQSPIIQEGSEAEICENSPANGSSTISNIIIGSSLFSLGVVVGKFLL